MKNFLAVDTSGNHLAVVVGKGEETFSVYVPDCAMKHSVSVMPAVDEALKKASLSLQDCDVFSACVGAGSFTGIRIGISVVKGFCLATKKPSLPVTSFDVIAYNGVEDTGKKLCLVDALHDAYYVCGYENETVVYPPDYIEESAVLALQEQGYRLVACSTLPICERAEVEKANPKHGCFSF
jgi:tRNA threonylcarbamoyl adenosine modification protein YeaZ